VLFGPVGYTRLTEERGDAAAATLAEALAVLVDRSSREHSGVPVKWLGDGVMVHFRDPAGAVLAALELVEQVPEAGLPPAHVGVAAGPVLVQGGDYFGRTVNLAPRIAVHASASRVLVSERVAERAPPLGVTFVEVGLVQLEGIARPSGCWKPAGRNLRRFRFVSTKPAHPSRPGRASRDRRPRTNY
jgi:adenylate cyclase